MRLALAALAVLSATLLVPSSARAGKPTVLGPLTDEGVYYPVLECPGFQVANRYVATVFLRYTADRQGNVIRLAGQTWGVDTFVNMSTGKELASPYHNNTTIEVPSGEAAVRGVIAKVIVPGVGPIFRDVGRVVVDGDNFTVTAGTHQWIDGDFGALYEALE